MQFNSNWNHPPKCHVSFNPHLETLEVTNGLNKSIKRQYYAKPGFIVIINSSSSGSSNGGGADDVFGSSSSDSSWYMCSYIAQDDLETTILLL